MSPPTLFLKFESNVVTLFAIPADGARAQPLIGRLPPAAVIERPEYPPNVLVGLGSSKISSSVVWTLGCVGTTVLCFLTTFRRF